jgi:hypothetical protein
MGELLIVIIALVVVVLFLSGLVVASVFFTYWRWRCPDCGCRALRRTGSGGANMIGGRLAYYVLCHCAKCDAWFKWYSAKNCERLPKKPW